MDEETRGAFRQLERTIVLKIMRDLEIPDDIRLLVKCLVDAGCPPRCVIDGLREFGEEMSLRELLKGLPIKFEED